MNAVTPPPGSEKLNVLLIGNNPIDMSRILEKLNRVPGKTIITEIAFDLKTIIDRLVRFQPHFILIDDNIGRAEMMETVTRLSTDEHTRHIPITVLKNSNYHESWPSNGVLDYLLKQNLSPESIYAALRNSLKLRRTQEFLYQTYRRRKEQLLSLISTPKSGHAV